ncbi:MAG: galactokinase [Myxococcaceae bacterium]|nr:galactokinase [Myxococcaceae bacterium]MCI0669166.1 galactokinase [Myxococcaceae bacterium]
MPIHPDTLRARFREHFVAEPRLFRAPGRVNLIGEHTDYNDGFVLPLALEKSTWVAAAPRAGKRVRVHSAAVGETKEFELGTSWPARRGAWVDYVEGMAVALMQAGVPLAGADLLIDTEVPVGAGLSSSAALELAVGRALIGVSECELTPVALARAGQRAEHEAVGIRCGLMDQLTAALGQAGHALLIDCRTNEATPVPLPLDDVSLLVVDTRVKHSLATSAYNTRRAECEEGARSFGASSLRDVALDAFHAREAQLRDPVRRRVRHVLEENARTLDAADALRRGDWVRLGQRMSASHRSLRDDFEVSCAELDFVVDTALALPGVLGARMTGGGFGGCAVVLGRHAAEAALSASLRAAFARWFGREPGLFFTRAGPGAGEVRA